MIGEVFRDHLPGKSVRLDISLIVGHHKRWSGGNKPTQEDLACMKRLAHLLVRAGFRLLLACGGEASKALRGAAKQAGKEGGSYQESGLASGLGEARREVTFSGTASSCLTSLQTLIHPQGALPEGKGLALALLVSEQYDACLDRLICAWTGVPTPPARVRVSTFTSFLASGLKDGGDGSRGSVLDQIRIQRVDEYGKHPFELHEWPGIVQLFVTTETGATTTAEFLDLNWSPSDQSIPEPWSPGCFYLSKHGVRGGKPSPPRCGGPPRDESGV